MGKRMYDKLFDLVDKYGYTPKGESYKFYFDPFRAGLMVLKNGERIGLWFGGKKVYDDTEESEFAACYFPGIWEQFVDNLLEHEEDNSRWPGAGARDNKTLEELFRQQAEANRRRISQITKQVIKVAKCGEKEKVLDFTDYCYKHKITFEDGSFSQMRVCYRVSQFIDVALIYMDTKRGEELVFCHYFNNRERKVDYDFANGKFLEHGYWEATIDELYHQLSEE